MTSFAQAVASIPPELAPPFDSYSDLSNYSRPAQMTRAIVWAGGVASAWRWSSNAATQVWHIGATGGGSWQLQPLYGRIYLGTLPLLQYDANAALALGATLWLPSGATSITQTITVAGVLSIGRDPGGYLVGNGLLDAAVVMQAYPYAPSVDVDLGYKLIGVTAAQDKTRTAALRLDGSGWTGGNATQDVLWRGNRFKVETIGAYQGMATNCNAFQDSFGYESPIYMSRFDLTVWPSPDGTSSPCQHAIRFMQGSGTGNIIEHIQGQINGTNAAEGVGAIHFDAPRAGTVVGDVVLEKCHLIGSSPKCGLYSWGRGDWLSGYADHISAGSAQLDGGITQLMTVASPPVKLQNFNHWGVSNGGGDAFSLTRDMAPVVQGIIQDSFGDLRVLGNPFYSTQTGTFTCPVFEIRLEPYASVKVDLRVGSTLYGLGQFTLNYSFEATANNGVLSFATNWGPALSGSGNPLTCSLVDAGTDANGFARAHVVIGYRTAGNGSVLKPHITTCGADYVSEKIVPAPTQVS